MVITSFEQRSFTDQLDQSASYIISVKRNKLLERGAWTVIKQIADKGHFNRAQTNASKLASKLLFLLLFFLLVRA